MNYLLFNIMYIKNSNNFYKLNDISQRILLQTKKLDATLNFDKKENNEGQFKNDKQKVNKVYSSGFYSKQNVKL